MEQDQEVVRPTPTVRRSITMRWLRTQHRQAKTELTLKSWLRGLKEEGRDALATAKTSQGLQERGHTPKVAMLLRTPVGGFHVDWLKRHIILQKSRRERSLMLARASRAGGGKKSTAKPVDDKKKKGR